MGEDNQLVPMGEWGKLAPLFKGGDITLPFVQELFLLECDVAGTFYVEHLDEKTANLQDGSPVSLVREPNNPYDSLAIRVDNEKGEKLGYVPRRKNEVLARLLDGGKMLYGKFVEKSVNKHDQGVSLTIRIFMRDV